MNKYSRVYFLATRLTADPIWRAFFITYLLAETEAERQSLSERFWKEVSSMPDEQQEKIRAEFSENLKKLPALTAELLGRVKSSTALVAPALAA